MTAPHQEYTYRTPEQVTRFLNDALYVHKINPDKLYIALARIVNVQIQNVQKAKEAQHGSGQ